MPKVAIHCKASNSDGMGHIYRQINLAIELCKQGWEVFFFIPRFMPAIELLARSNFVPTLVEPESQFSDYFNKSFDIAILDIQDTSESLICSIKEKIPLVASFEDLGPGRNYVDIIIDCNLSASAEKNFTIATRTLFGTDYSVLHPDCAKYNVRLREFNSTAQSALITMGATDPQGLTLPLTKFLLQEKNNLKLTVLIALNTVNALQLKELATQYKLLNVLDPITNMAQTLWNHEVVICAGGITLHEAIAVGTPAFVINQAKHQESKARFIEKSGAAINLGMGNKYNITKLREALNLRKPDLEAMSLKGKKLIDGRGIFRVIEAITEATKK